MVYGGECTYLLSEAPRIYCAAPTEWVHFDKGGKQPIHVLCDAHRAPASVRIPEGATRAAPSDYLLKR